MVAEMPDPPPRPNEMSRINERTVLKGQQFCRIILLDGKDYEMQIHKNARGKELFEKLAQSLDLVEKDYFGLSYRDVEDKRNWLNAERRIAKQLKNLPWVFWFEVKFYPPEPNQLQEELTRYYLCLQVRNDVVSGKLPCSFMTYALLGSLLMQAQLGDYDADRHGPPESYLSDFSFAPRQSHELLQKICDLHKTHHGQSSAEVEMAYLESAKKLAMYGVDLHQAKDSEGAEILLGVCSAGLLVYRDKLRINRFAWPKILKISYRRNGFYIKIRPGEFEQRETTVGFKLPSSDAAERLWVASVEHHTFFRLMAPENTPKKGLIRFGSSKYRYSGRTQYQTRLASGLIERPQPYVPRSVSAGPLGSRSLDALADKSTNKKLIRPVSTMIYDERSANEQNIPVASRGKSVEYRNSDLDLDERLAKVLDSVESPKRTYRVDEPPGNTSGVKSQRSFDEVPTGKFHRSVDEMPRNGDFNAQQTLPSDRSTKKQYNEPIAVVVDDRKLDQSPVGKGYIYGNVTPPTKKSKKDEDRERRRLEKEEKRRKEQLEKERRRFEKQLKRNPDIVHGITVLEGTPIHSQSQTHSPRNGNQYASSSSPMSSPASDDDHRRTSSKKSDGKQKTSPRSYVTTLPYSTSTPYKQVAPTSLSMDESGLNERLDLENLPRVRTQQPSAISPQHQPMASSPRHHPAATSPRHQAQATSPRHQSYQSHEPYVSTLVQSEELSEKLPDKTFSTFAPDGSIHKTTKSSELKSVKKSLEKQTMHSYAVPLPSESEADDQIVSHRATPIDPGRFKSSGVPPPSSYRGGVSPTTVTYLESSTHSPPADPAVTEYISSETKSNGKRTVETIKYKTEKDGHVETHVEHRVTIHSAGNIDHDAELTAAIMEATKMNPNMTVEKVEVRRTAHQTEL